MHLDDDQIWEYLFLDNRENETIENHLAECELCRTKTEAVEKEELILKQMLHPEVSVNFTEKTVAKILAEEPSSAYAWIKIFQILIISSMLLISALIIAQLFEKNISLKIPDLLNNFWIISLIPVLSLVFFVYFLEQRKIFSHL